MSLLSSLNSFREEIREVSFNPVEINLTIRLFNKFDEICGIFMQSNIDDTECKEVNNVLDILLAMDDILRNSNSNIDMSLKLWKTYLLILKNYYKSIYNDTISRLSAALRKYVLEIIGSLSVPANENQMQNKLSILYFFCQRVSATLAFMLPKLTKLDIDACFLSLGSFRGLLLSQNINDNFSQSMTLKSVELFQKAILNPVESTLWCPPSYHRLLFHKYATAVEENQNRNPHEILGTALLCESDLEYSESNIAMMNNDAGGTSYSIGCRCGHCIEEIVHCIEILCKYYHGFYEDRILLEILGRVAGRLMRILNCASSDDKTTIMVTFPIINCLQIIVLLGAWSLQRLQE